MKTTCDVCGKVRTITNTGNEDRSCLCDIRAQQRAIDTMDEILTIARKAGMEVEPVVTVKIAVKKYR